MLPAKKQRVIMCSNRRRRRRRLNPAVPLWIVYTPYPPAQVGTTSVEKSEILAAMLQEESIPYQVG